MDRDLLRLKLILNQHCTELQNLTISDLQDLKWLTKQKLILSLVSKSPLFTDQCEEIERILEQRNKDVLLLKSKNVSREQKMENDTVYRTCILRVLLNCAEILKWPKALEAFSNPLQDIMTDNSLFLDCIQYCIQILFDNMPKRQHLTSSATEVISSPLLSKRNNPKSPIVKYSQDVSETTIHHDNEICLDKGLLFLSLSISFNF